MAKKRIYPIKRFPELLYPSTNSFSVWLAILSFSLFIVASSMEYIIGAWNMTILPHISYPTPLFYPTPIQLGIAVVGAIFIIVSLIAFVGFLVVSLRSAIGVKVEDTTPIKPTKITIQIESSELEVNISKKEQKVADKDNNKIKG